MRIAIDLDLDGLEQLLSRLLPLGGKIQPTGLELDMSRLRVEAQAPLVGRVTLVAKVRPAAGALVLSDFDLEGAGIARGMALGTLRSRLAELDERWNGVRAWGESDGDRLHLEWTATGGPA